MELIARRAGAVVLTAGTSRAGPVELAGELVRQARCGRAPATSWSREACSPAAPASSRSVSSRRAQPDSDEFR
ncbi:hypothetical protein [Nonomuraea typhae]|uniref:hypothetical protein n=1 Tax=Nonomuraea typhae TaxID=2603600 RepID=UPI0012FC9BF3|nr:hypothetical protein [Nonomuraea typhae]